MKINENLLRNSVQPPPDRATLYDATSKISSTDGDFTKLTLSGFKNESNMIAFYNFPHNDGEGVPNGALFTFSFLMKNYSASPLLISIQETTNNPSQLDAYETKRVTITARRNASVYLQIRINRVGGDTSQEIQVSVPRFIKLELGTEATLWTPAHADLTPEQIAMMKYGEYKEIKSF